MKTGSPWLTIISASMVCLISCQQLAATTFDLPVVRKGVATYGHEFVGFRDGWRGPLEGTTRPLGIAEVRGILPRGGTILGSSRTNPFKIDGGVEKINMEANAWLLGTLAGNAAAVGIPARRALLRARAHSRSRSTRVS